MSTTTPASAERAALRAQVYRGLWQAVWRFRRRTLAALALLVLAKLAAVGVPLLLKSIVDRFGAPDAPALELQRASPPPGADLSAWLVVPAFLMIGYALLRFAGTLFTELRDLVFARVTVGTVAGIAERVYGHLLALSPRFHTARNTGALVRDVERGVAGTGFLLGAGLFTVLPTLFELLAILVVMTIGYSGWFTVIIVSTFAVFAIWTTTQTVHREVRQRRVNELDSHAHGRLVDGLINVEAVKSFGRERLERERYAQVLAEWMSGSLANQRALSRLHVGQSAIIALGVAGVMLLAGDQTLRGQMTVGDLVLVNSYLIQICLPLNALGFVFRETRDALVNTERLFALLNQQPDIVDRDHATTLRLAGGAIRFDNVAFGYEPGRPILQALELEIPAGRTLAVVGGSGSGKSTLARLLLRLYDPAAGRVTIDGQDVRELTLASLRTAIGVVPQDTVLFNETIAFNIAVGRPGAPHEDIVAAARAAQVHEFIAALPAGYDTRVGERGLKLSGGEKQRIAIARAFLKNPPIMILDEATSALDSRSERAIQAELDRIAAGRTTLVIAHRLSTIVDADEIVVMDRGRIVERGQHGTLLAANGLYAQLWTLQRQQQQVEQLERDLARQPINLAQLLAGTVDALQAPLAARQVRLFTAIDTDEARVSGDPAALGQSLYEAAAAAVQSTPSAGRIELRLERAGPDARITILDGQRAGAPPPVQPLDDTLAELPPLDPPALRAALERQGGRVTIEPPNAARGRRVTFELPLMAVGVDRFVASNDGALAPLAPQPLAGLTLMVIDDALDARETLKMLLELDGAQVLAFASGREALAWLDAQPAAQWPAVLLSDIAMGDENGLDVMRAVRRLEARRGVPLEARLPAIALTGHGGAENRVQALMAGFQQHLAKPVQPRELVTTIYLLAGRPAGSGPRLATSAPPSGETSREKHR